VALREEDGRLHQSPGRGDRSLRRSWAQLAGEGDKLPWFSAGSGLECDDAGCLYRTAGRERWLAIDRQGWSEQGTHAVWLHESGGPTIESVAEWQGDRPWRPVAEP
jgi:hypothetical protein